MKLRLVYTHQETNRPILANVIMKTGAPINILEAQMTPGSGQMVVDAPVNGEKLREIISAFEKEGVRVQEIISAISIDVEKCISCGACVSPCPVSAIKQKSDWSVELDEKKCIRCKICVDACPMRAVNLI